MKGVVNAFCNTSGFLNTLDQTDRQVSSWQWQTRKVLVAQHSFFVSLQQVQFLEAAQHSNYTKHVL